MKHAKRTRNLVAEMADPAFLLETSDAPSLDEIGAEENKSSDANFEAELNYEGYDHIEEYDNGEYGADVDGGGDPERKLVFKDRTELNNGEEDSLDPQENRRA